MSFLGPTIRSLAKTFADSEGKELVSTIARSSKAFLENYAGPAGKPLVETLERFEDTKALHEGAGLQLLQHIKQQHNIKDIHDNVFLGRQVQPNEVQATQALQGMVQRREAQTGVKLKDGIKIYDAKKTKEIATYLQQSGQVSLRKDAEKAARSIVNAHLGRNGAKYLNGTGYNLPSNFLADEGYRLAEFNATTADRLASIKHFSSDDVILSKALGIIKKTQGVETANNVADMLDVYFHVPTAQKYRYATDGVSKTAYYEAVTRWEQGIKKGTSYALAGRIAIPHLFQPLNIALQAGVKYVGSFLKEIGNNGYAKTLDTFLKTGAMNEEIMAQLRAEARGERSWIRSYIHQPFFHKIRFVQTMMTAVAGKHFALDLLDQHSRGLIKESEPYLKMLGVDAGKYKAATKAEQEEMLNAAGFRMTKNTMFTRSGLNTPYTWEKSPVIRLTRLYNHFSFNEGRIIAESFKRARDAGPLHMMKWLAVMGIMFPGVGEVVKTMENIATGHGVHNADDTFSPTGNIYTDEYIDAMSHAAGFGIMFSIFRAGRRNLLREFAIGPFFNQAATLGGDIVGMKPDKLARDTTGLIPVIGPAIKNQVFPKEKKGANPYGGK